MRPGRTCSATSGARGEGKTSARAIPTLLSAPGRRVRDLQQARPVRRDPRCCANSAGSVWNFDPEQLAGGRARLVVEPAHLRHLRPPGARADRRVRGRLPRPRRAARPVLRPRRPGARRQLPARRGARRPADHPGVPVVDAAATTTSPRGSSTSTGSSSRRPPCSTTSHAPFEQRGGVYGTARADPLVPPRPRHRRWVTPTGPADRRPQLDLAAFVQTADTLYLHSKEGQGSSAGLVTALAMALCDAAEQLAKRSPGGRLPVPLVGVLDEAANICRWRAAPRPLLALRVARDPAAHPAAVVVPRRAGVGADRDAQALGRLERARLRRRRRPRRSSSPTSRS